MKKVISIILSITITMCIFTGVDLSAFAYNYNEVFCNWQYGQGHNFENGVCTRCGFPRPEMISIEINEIVNVRIDNTNTYLLFTPEENGICDLNLHDNDNMSFAILDNNLAYYFDYNSGTTDLVDTIFKYYANETYVIEIMGFGAANEYGQFSMDTHTHKYDLGYCGCGDKLTYISNDGKYEYVLDDENRIIILTYLSNETDVVVPAEIDGAPVYKISSNAFTEKDAQTITISNGIEELDIGVFNFCQNLQSAYIPSSVKSLSLPFLLCISLTDIEIDAGNQYYTIVDGSIFSKDKRAIIQYCPGKTNSYYEVPNGTTRIAAYCFAGNIYLEQLKLARSVEVIEFGAFASAQNLSKVDIPYGLKQIEGYAFDDCPLLDTEYVLPASVTSIDVSAFIPAYDNERTADVYVLNPDCEFTSPYIEGGLTLHGYKNSTTEQFYQEYSLYYNYGFEKIDNTPIDYSAFEVALKNAEKYLNGNISLDSYNTLNNLLDSCVYSVSTTEITQRQVDDYTTQILEAMSNIVPYFNLDINAQNGTYTVSYNGEGSNKPKHSVLSGTRITLLAAANDGYEFKGWYDTVSNRLMSNNEQYNFRLSGNTTLKAVFVKESSATLTFTTYSSCVLKTETKTASEWNNVTDISNLLPEVPYRYGYTNGKWVYDNSEVLSRLRNGENVSLTPEYDSMGTELPEAPEADGDTPVLELHYRYDEANDTGSFLMMAGIPENCSIEAIGTAFYYDNDEGFDPTKFILNINDKMLISRFNTDEAEDNYITNISGFNAYKNWCARGYITYYDNNDNLITVYSNQINIKENHQV